MAKRFIDIMAAGLGLILLAPLLAGIGILVRLRDGSPVLYRAVRVGRNGKVFHLFKFRTMVSTPKNGESAPGSSVTVWDDPRVTPLGRTLRRHKLDELPQLVNVLRGEMSLVGPRPEDPEYVALYTEEQRRVLSVRPGITGVAALQYSDEETLLRGADWEQVYRERIMPAKIQLEIDYLARRSLSTDIGLIILTFARLFGLSRKTDNGGPNG
jgi:lipopolysaccharide/colanic/teichoic acid biosynthesis glycosyltransferase